MADCIARRIVQIMSPFVYLVRPRFDGLDPCAGFVDVCNTIWGQDPHDLSHGDRAEVFQDNKVNKIVNVRKVVSFQLLNRDLAVEAKRENVFAGLADIRRVPIQTMDLFLNLMRKCGC